MTATYLDTSRIMRLLMREGDFRLVEEAIRSDPMSSVLTVVELRAATFKRWRDRDISVSERDSLLRFVASTTLPLFTLFPIDDVVLTEAEAIVESYAIRSLDALHLATAVVADRRLSLADTDLDFCTADRRQAEAARAIFGTARVLFVPPWR